MAGRLIKEESSESCGISGRNCKAGAGSPPNFRGLQTSVQYKMSKNRNVKKWWDGEKRGLGKNRWFS